MLFPSPPNGTQSEQSQWHICYVFQTLGDFLPPIGASPRPFSILLVLLAVRGTPTNTQAWGSLTPAEAGGLQGETVPAP